MSEITLDKRQELITRWQTNTECFGELPKHMRNIAREIGQVHFRVRSEGSQWVRATTLQYPDFSSMLTYQLDADYALGPDEIRCAVEFNGFSFRIFCSGQYIMLSETICRSPIPEYFFDRALFRFEDGTADYSFTEVTKRHGGKTYPAAYIVYKKTQKG